MAKVGKMEGNRNADRALADLSGVLYSIFDAEVVRVERLKKTSFFLFFCALKRTIFRQAGSTRLDCKLVYIKKFDNVRKTRPTIKNGVRDRIRFSKGTWTHFFSQHWPKAPHPSWSCRQPKRKKNTCIEKNCAIKYRRGGLERPHRWWF